MFFSAVCCSSRHEAVLGAKDRCSRCLFSVSHSILSRIPMFHILSAVISHYFPFIAASMNIVELTVWIHYLYDLLKASLPSTSFARRLETERKKKVNGFSLNDSFYFEVFMPVYTVRRLLGFSFPFLTCFGFLNLSCILFSVTWNVSSHASVNLLQVSSLYSHLLRSNIFLVWTKWVSREGKGGVEGEQDGEEKEEEEKQTGGKSASFHPSTFSIVFFHGSWICLFVGINLLQHHKHPITRPTNYLPPFIPPTLSFSCCSSSSYFS